MIQRKKRIVLFLPHRADPEQGVRVSADLTPLELLQIAGLPDQNGYECVLIDAMVEPDYEKMVLEACDGALLFASSCILGFQVAHGARVANGVRQKFPSRVAIPYYWRRPRTCTSLIAPGPRHSINRPSPYEEDHASTIDHPFDLHRSPAGAQRLLHQRETQSRNLLSRDARQ